MDYPPLFPELAPNAKVLSAPQRRRIFDKHGNEVVWPQVETTISYRSVGDLVLPSGKVIASDPDMIRDFLPFKRHLKPGRYPVELMLAKFAEPRRGERVALAIVRVSDETPSRWEVAPREDEDPRDLDPGETFGYGVDSATGCFADAAVLNALSKGPSEDRFREWLSNDPTADGHAGAITVDEQFGANIVAFRSGMGDGAYSSYWGLGTRGEPCCLLTDFDVVDLEIPVEHSRRKRWRLW